MQISDGKGSGRGAEVKVGNRLANYSTSVSQAHYESRVNGGAYTWTGTNYNYDAADTILLIRNDSSQKDLVITDISIRGDTETDFTIHYTDGAVFTPTGTAVIGMNANRTSGNAADATAIADETANTQGEIAIVGRLTADLAIDIDTRGAIILGQNDCIAVDFTTDGGEAYVTIAGHYVAVD